MLFIGAAQFLILRTKYKTARWLFESSNSQVIKRSVFVFFKKFSEGISQVDENTASLLYAPVSVTVAGFILNILKSL